MECGLDGREISQEEAIRLAEIRRERLLGFQRLNQLSFLQIISSCPLFIAGVVTLVMALPHVDYPVFNFGPVVVSILVFPMALIGLLATRKATENQNVIETTATVKCMIVCNFALSLLCSLLTGVSSFYSFYIVEQCSDMNSEYYELCLPNSKANIGLSVVSHPTLVVEYYELCLPNSKANIGLSVVDGIVCLILLLLSVLGTAHFCTHGFQLCFPSDSDESSKDINMPVILPGHSASIAKTK